MNVNAYKTPQKFLDATERLLEQKEIENNLILGVCNGFADKTKEYQDCVFMNCIDDEQIQVTSIKTIPKAIIAGTTRNVQHIKALADYYLDHEIDLTGIIGESFYASSFSEFYGKNIADEATLIIHKLTTVNKLPLKSGMLVTATDEDTDLITEWTMKFEEDAQTFPQKPRGQILLSTRNMIASGNIFKWIDQGEIVCMAGIVRKTKNVGIVGLVYTPDRWRAQGYATSCVQKLTEYILQNGFKYCSLFTDASNPTPNNIYKKIGYIPIAEFKDIKFELIRNQNQALPKQ